MEQSTEVTLEEKVEVYKMGTEDKNGHETSPVGDGLVPSGLPPTGVKYRVEYRNLYTGRVVHSTNVEKLDFEPVNVGTGDIFDIVTSFSTLEEEFQSNKEPTVEDVRKAPRVVDTRKKISMHIHSPTLIHALRSVVKYYPGQPLLGESIIIPQPYSILVHHEKELREYGERCHPSKQMDPVCPKEKTAYHEIKKLLDFLDQTVMPAVRLERDRNERGLETFDMLWLRLKPGTTTKSQDAGSTYEYGSVIEFVGGGGGWAQAWDVGYWTLDYNGTYLGTSKRIATIDRFEGEREITDSYVMEDSAFEDPVHESVENLVEQGKKFFDLLSKKCQYYQGTTFEFPYSRVSLCFL